MSGDNVDRVQRGYRAAITALDERPSATTRAAILAAAARRAHAGPRDAATPIAVPARRMPRWPMAAAAAVLLSTLAVMLAVRTEQDMPTFTPPAEPAASRVQVPAEVPALPNVASSPTTDKALESSATPPPAPSLARERGPAQPAVASAAPSKDAAAKAIRDAAPPVAEAKVAAPTAERAKEEATALQAPASAPAAAPPAVARRPAAPATDAVGAASAEANAPQPLAKRQAARGDTAERRSNETAAVTAPAPAALGAVSGTVRSEADATAANAVSPWLERIIKLRREGRHAEADAELKQFRARYPQVVVPPEALPPTGTR